MTLEEMKKAYQDNLKLIERIETKIISGEKDYLKRIHQNMIESLKELNESLDKSMWSLYDYAIDGEI